MPAENPLLGALLNVVRLAFLFLLIAVVALFILAKSGAAKEDDEGEGAAETVQSEVSEGQFGKGWTDLKYRVKFHWAAGNLKYELFVHPYDPRVEKLRRSGLELVLLSFVNEERDRIIPLKAPVRIEMRELKRVEAEDEEGKSYFKGWLVSGELKGEEGRDEKIAAAEMGWLFSDDLLALLRNIRKERLIREARERARESRAAGVSTR